MGIRTLTRHTIAETVARHRRRAVFPERGLHVTGGFFLLLAAALLVSPPTLAAAVLLAAAMHEGGHFLALRAFRVPVEGVCLCASGAVIHARGARRLSYGRELAVTLAGPATNLLSALLSASLAARLSWEWGYLFAGTNVLLGVYNLLPVPPLDGGRALYLAVAYCFGPTAGDAAERAAGLSCALALVGIGAYLTAVYGGALFLLAALGLLFGVLQEFALAKIIASVYNTLHGQTIGTNPASRAEARPLRRRGI